MADTKITSMVAVTSVAATDVFPVVQGGINKKATAEQIRTMSVVAETVSVNASLSLLVPTNIAVLDATPIALLLADGTEGREKTIVMSEYGAAATVTPTSAAGFTSILFNNVGQTASLKFISGKWYIMSVRGATVT